MLPTSHASYPAMSDDAMISRRPFRSIFPRCARPHAMLASNAIGDRDTASARAYHDKRCFRQAFRPFRHAHVAFRGADAADFLAMPPDYFSPQHAHANGSASAN